MGVEPGGGVRVRVGVRVGWKVHVGSNVQVAVGGEGSVVAGIEVDVGTRTRGVDVCPGGRNGVMVGTGVSRPETTVGRPANWVGLSWKKSPTSPVWTGTMTRMRGSAL